MANDCVALEQSLSYVIGAERAIILPSIVNPKLILPRMGRVMRWRGSAFYPAFKLRAKLWRLMQRCRALSGFATCVQVPNHSCILDFIPDNILGVTHTSVLLGTPGATRKIIVQLWQKHKLVGFLKCAATPHAAEKIEYEASVLQVLPEGMGPRLLKRGEINGASALLLAPVLGRMFPARLPRLTYSLRQLETSSRFTDISSYLSKLPVKSVRYSIDDHPKIKWLKEKAKEIVNIEPWLEALRKRQGACPELVEGWPIVVQHGDFAPWNVVRQKDGFLAAIDWEEGDLEGFPHLDLIYFILQTAFLIHRWTPEQACKYALNILTINGVNTPQADSLLRLASLDAYLRYQTIADDKAKALQAFRWNVVHYC